MLTEQLERRVRGESLVELINKPLDMSQQVEVVVVVEDGGGLDDEYQPAMQVSQGSHKQAVMHPDSSNLPMVCPKLENLHQLPPTSEADTPRSPPRSDIEQRCRNAQLLFSPYYHRNDQCITSTTSTIISSNHQIHHEHQEHQDKTKTPRCEDHQKGTISPPPLTRLPTLTAR